MSSRILVLFLMATLIGSPFSFAGRCSDFFKAKSKAVAAYLIEVRDTRGARLLLVDPPEVDPAPTWRHPLRTAADFLVNKPTEALTQELFYSKKRPSGWVWAAIIMAGWHFGHDVPADLAFKYESEKVVAESSTKYEAFDLDLLQNDLMYEGFKNLLESGKTSKAEALKGVYAFRLNLVNYASSVRDLDLNSKDLRLVTEFVSNPLFQQARQTISDFKLGDEAGFEIYRAMHRYYREYINLELALEYADAARDVEQSNDYRQKVLAAYQAGRMDKTAFRYLIEKDIELKYSYDTKSIIEKYTGRNLQLNKSIDAVRADILRELGLLN